MVTGYAKILTVGSVVIASIVIAAAYFKPDALRELPLEIGRGNIDDTLGSDSDSVADLKILTELTERATKDAGILPKEQVEDEASQELARECRIAQAVGHTVARAYGRSTRKNPYAAVANGNLRKVKELIAGGLSPDYGANTLDGPLLGIAALTGQEAIVEFLLQAGAKPNKRDSSLNTALHAAVISCQPEIVNILLQWEADELATDIRGDRPIDLARKKRLKEVIGLLSQ